MDRRNQDRPNAAQIAATVGIGAAVGYGVYKLFDSMFGSANEPHQENRSSENIEVVNTVEQCRRSMREVKSHCDEYNVLGFDCEWVQPYGSTRRPVALLQLATHRGLCVLIRLCKLQHIPKELQEILEDGNIVKVGVAPYKDAKHVYDDYQVRVANTIDLRFLAEAAGCRPGKLSKMSEDYLGVSLNKTVFGSEEWEESMDWEAPSLSDEQIEYAAKDAEVSFQLFKYFGGKIAPGKGLKYIVDYHVNQYINRNYGPQLQGNWARPQ